MNEENVKNNKSEVALREERVLEFWEQNKIFEKVSKKVAKKGDYVFYDGPPTANGMPGLHHVEPQSFKDLIPRYKTMRGYNVLRKAGWDTHGLPVELQVEKALGLKSKKDIEKYGVELFNQKCKESVWQYKAEWMKMRTRMGFWTDLENAYVTYTNNYIEALWGVVQKADERGFLYKDFKILPWCPRCGTALSSHELNQPGAYKDVKDLSVYVKFKIIGGNDAFAGSLSPSVDGALPLGSSACETPRQKHIATNFYILAWTTTPWTLPGNVALAVGNDIDYVKVKFGGEILILAEARLSVLGGEYEILEKLKGKDLIGLEYEPLFPYLSAQGGSASGGKDFSESIKNAFKIYPADFVTTTDGTGVVHTAVMYGVDDFELGTKLNLPKYHLVNEEGKFIKGTGFLEGRYVKEADENGKPTLAVDIIDDLTKRGLLFKKENHLHSYPHCWRCDTPLIYYARMSWYFKMSALRSQLMAGNEKIHWEPEHIKHGRFGEWLDGIKDWAISRDRYWGTPIPVWQKKDGTYKTIGSLSELKKYTKKSGNKYFVMRHGEAENNMGELYKVDPTQSFNLTEKGCQQVLENIKNFKEKVDVIISSPFERTRETTKIVCEFLGFPLDKVIYDDRVQEWEVSSMFNGKTRKEMKQYYDNDYMYAPHESLADAESFIHVVKRTGDFLYDIESKYKDKTILLVSHAGAGRAMTFVSNGATFTDLPNRPDITKMLDNAEIKKLDFVPLPHNQNYELDFHKPYIDEIILEENGEQMSRTPEVMDVWFDSGAMPYAQSHVLGTPMDFSPAKADYISEAIDQTRGWFYTLHAVINLVNNKSSNAFKNVICLGHILDANGQKMSKSKGNVVDPWMMFDKYGADTLRLWMYSVNQPGESKNFDEKNVLELNRQVFGLLYNIVAFYELYRDKDLEIIQGQSLREFPQGLSFKNILDIWILARLNELIELTTKNLDSFKLLEPTRAMKDFINDLSTWYLRRSRDRLKDEDKNAKLTLYFVLKNLAKLMAPFAPFSAEDIWQKLKNEEDVESVHLVDWPKVSKGIFDMFSKKEEKVLKNMQIVRDIVSLGLEARQKAGIKVRQPLATLKCKVESGKLSSEYLELIKDELNVKEVLLEPRASNLETNVELDTRITPELKSEGDYRELVRAIQDMRKKMGLTPSDVVSFSFDTNEEGKKLIQNFEKELKKVILASEIKFMANDGDPIVIDELIFKIKVVK